VIERLVFNLTLPERAQAGQSKHRILPLSASCYRNCPLQGLLADQA